MSGPFPGPLLRSPLQHLLHHRLIGGRLATPALTWVLQVPTQLYILALHPKPHEGRGHFHLYSKLLGGWPPEMTEALYPSLRVAALLQALAPENHPSSSMTSRKHPAC